jgi:hypothetical protein
MHGPCWEAVFIFLLESVFDQMFVIVCLPDRLVVVMVLNLMIFPQSEIFFCLQQLLLTLTCRHISSDLADLFILILCFAAL